MDILVEKILIYGAVGLFLFIVVYIYIRKLKKESQVVGEKIKIAKESIKSLSKSAISEYLTDEKNEYLDGVDLKQDIYLTTFVSDINIQDRDTKVIDMTRKAA
ncbi:MAG: hypothetical protein HOG79_08450, partial [Prolixibacteraceae bacterium]|nr:hypothetical protein [Prolixibacteraceae bacterium]